MKNLEETEKAILELKKHMREDRVNALARSYAEEDSLDQAEEGNKIAEADEFEKAKQLGAMKIQERKVMLHECLANSPQFVICSFLCD